MERSLSIIPISVYLSCLTTCFCAFQRWEVFVARSRSLRPPLLSSSRWYVRIPRRIPSSSSSSSARFLDTRWLRMHAWTSNGDTALPNDGRAGHYRWRSDVLLVVRVAGKCSVSVSLYLSLSLFAHFTPYISAPINAKCASRRRRKSVIAVKGEGTIYVRVFRPSRPRLRKFTQWEFHISVRQFYSLSVWIIILDILVLSYWIYCTLLRPATHTRVSVPGHGSRDRDSGECSLSLCTYIHYIVYIQSRVPSFVVKIDARSRNAWLYMCRAPSRLSLSIGCHLVICSLRDTPRACLQRGNVSLFVH